MREGKLHCKYAQNDRSIKLKIAMHAWTGAEMIEKGGGNEELWATRMLLHQGSGQSKVIKWRIIYEGRPVGPMPVGHVTDMAAFSIVIIKPKAKIPLPLSLSPPKKTSCLNCNDLIQEIAK